MDWNNSLSFLQSIFPDGDANYWNDVSIHPYRWNYPESVTGDYGTVRSYISDYTSNNPPLIDTEWGYTSGWYDSSQGGPLSYNNAEILKGEFLARSLLLNMKNSVPLSIIYEWMDDSNDKTDPTGQANFGLVGTYTTRPTNFLPAYNAVDTMTSQLTGYTFARRISTGVSTDYIFKFTNGTNDVYACWTDLGPYGEYDTGSGNTVNIPIGSKVPVTVTTYDGGRVTKTTSGANGYSCKETEGPQYVRKRRVLRNSLMPEAGGPRLNLH